MNTAMNITPTLPQLGWKLFFQQQLTLEELAEFMIGRVVEQHRSSLIVMAEQGQVTLTLAPNSERVCYWILFDESLRVYRSLERQLLKSVRYYTLLVRIYKPYQK